VNVAQDGDGLVVAPVDDRFDDVEVADDSPKL
jgi:hypothetical protein